MSEISNQEKNQLSRSSIRLWRIAQTLIWLVGVSIVFCLIFFPDIGIHAFWNVLIPIAPALLVLATGLWRNICPMASTALLPRHLGLSKRKKISFSQSGKLNLVGIIALFLIVPLRHAIFDTNGMATAILILSLGLVAVISGALFEWKSAWCSGLCPVHPVEKLYGSNNRLKLPNAHCDNCHRCVVPCPDTTPAIQPMSSQKTPYHKLAGILTVGGFPGFVWAWFQIPDFKGPIGIEELMLSYQLPIISMLTSCTIFLILRFFIDEKLLINVFAASAISCYYWFRIPALFGYGVFPGDGMLVDLSGTFPEWSFIGMAVILNLFFFWRIVFRKQKKISWVIRPAYAESVRNVRTRQNNRYESN